jgi:dienelactone hydrolase
MNPTIRQLPIDRNMNPKNPIVLMAALLASSALLATDHVVEDLSWEFGGTTFTGQLIVPENASGPLPGLLMIPSWMGPTERAAEKAAWAAGDRYVVLVADVYGADVRPQNSGEAAQAAGALRSDRELMRQRGQAALEALRGAASHAPLDPERIAAIGFCFGGGAVLELARSGADLDAVISFHGDLQSPTLQSDTGRIQGKVLVLHGAADPLVPHEDVIAFADAMNATDVDWSLIAYGGAVHSFTNPYANSPGTSQYDATAARRSLAAMRLLLDEIWAE